MAELLLDKVVGKNLLVSLQLERIYMVSIQTTIRFIFHDTIRFIFQENICCLTRIIQNKTKDRFPLP